MSLSPVTAVRLSGLIAGLSLVALLALQAWRVPASSRPAGVDVGLRAVATGEVGARPSGGAVRSRVVTPGGPAARGRVRLSNRTAGVLAARPHLSGGDPVLDRLVEIELRVAGRMVFRGSMERLRAGSAPAIVLPRGGRAVVGLRLRVPEAAGEEATARTGRWALKFSEDAGER
jgi:hypothetical protein